MSDLTDRNWIGRRVRNAFSRFREHDSQPLDGGGERVDIDLTRGTPDYESFDMYEKSHWRRYEFALEHVVAGGTTGDFACGTGYGTVLLAGQSALTIGADRDADVIRAVSRRYRRVSNVTFIQADLLDLSYDNVFDTIVSFETIEHFSEEQVPRLMAKFAQALKAGGTFVMSTPYMQQASPEALAMGFHHTFLIDESRVRHWLDESGMRVDDFWCQNYRQHDVVRGCPPDRDFLIAVATRVTRR